MVKKIAALNDLSGFGKCSLSAAIPIISALGVQACPLPTAVLSNQSCYSSYFIKDLTEEMDGITEKWKELGFSFDGIYTGYIASEKQAGNIISFINDFKKEGTILLSDPVMGDEGIVYPGFTEGLCGKIKEIASLAEIITPNITEIGILAENKADYLYRAPKDNGYMETIRHMAESILAGNTKTVVVTGIEYKGEEDSEKMFYNAVVTKNSFQTVKSPVLKGSFSGTGDILASIICACAVRGIDVKRAVEIAAQFIYVSVKDTIKYETDVHDGVNFEKFLHMLTGIK